MKFLSLKLFVLPIIFLSSAIYLFKFIHFKINYKKLLGNII